jgi:ketosteroid isomerase-like protein
VTQAADDRAELVRLQPEWMRAMQERAADRLEELVADGFTFTAVHLDPEPMTREQWMAAALGGYRILSFAYEDIDVDLFGDTAVVHSRYSQTATFEGRSLSDLFRLTDVWRRRDGRR